MAESRRYALGTQLDIEQIILEAQHRWLRPAEICEILRNYQKFRISPEPPNRPPNGSLFLFDRKVLRYFRKDGHNWRKKKDGKTVKEAHERLKAGSIDVLHCYYAHGEENESFQRRSYWLLEEEQSHIVLVHYRVVKGNRTNFNRTREATEPTPGAQGTEDDIRSSEGDGSQSSQFHPYNYRVASQVTDTASLNSAQASEYEDVESEYTHQSSSSFHTSLDLQPQMVQKVEDGCSSSYFPASISNNYQGQCPSAPDVGFVSMTPTQKDENITSGGVPYMPEVHLDYSSWGNVMESSNLPYQSLDFQTPISSTQASTMSLIPGGNEFGSQAYNLEQWQSTEGHTLNISKWSIDQQMQLESAKKFTASSTEDKSSGLHNSLEPYNVLSVGQKNSPALNDLTVRLGDTDGGVSVKPIWNGHKILEGKAEHSSLRQPLLDGVRKESLKKLDSFDRWISKELEDVNESSHIQSSSANYWESVGNEDDDSNVTAPGHLDTYVMDPSLSQDQLFSIIDFSPNWAFSGSEIKILITGKFLKSQQEVEKCKWACMFGELEVPAEVIADGVLRCYTPLHEAGMVPFYVTSSNRFACSEVREFEFLVNSVQDEVGDMSNSTSEESYLLMRFVKLLNLTRPLSNQTIDPSAVSDLAHVTSKIDSLLLDDNDEWEHMRNLTSKDKFSVTKLKDWLLEKLLKDKLYLWLIQKVAEGGKGPGVLDDEGQGILHFAAALGYDWAIPPTVAAGVSVNFRDVNGWTALHWAASYGRERIVALLISLKANPGALTDPTPKYPSGRMAADFASSNGHKGIAGYLAESTLSSHLSSIQLDQRDGQSGGNTELEVVQTVSERTATPIDGELSHGLSLKDSLAAVRNATQAAARIHEVFRVQSFQRKQIKEYGDNEFGISDERALSLLAIKSNRAGHRVEPVHTAAIRIQNKFRSWKGRKEYLLIRQRIIKIQAHVRGHQVRKNYKKIIWSVGILDKVILRWRRKGSGLRGFKSDALVVEGSRGTDMSTRKEDDYDFLKEGRKQTEERLQKALARVKSMVQYPEARDQYRRVLNVVSEMQASKAKYDRILSNSDETADFDDDLIDLDALLEDDTSMAAAF